MKEKPEKLSDAYHNAVGANREYTVALVLTKMELGICLFGLGVFTVGMVFTAFSLPFVSVIVTAVMGVLGFALMLIVVLVGKQNGSRTAEELA